MSALQSQQYLNPFLQAAVQRYFAKNNVPLPEEKSESGDIQNDLLSKQKWKMLKSVPGNNSENTWGTMKVINKGLSPLTKGAGIGSKVMDTAKTVAKKIPGVALNAAVPATAAATAIGAGAYGANKLVQGTTNRIQQGINAKVDPVLNDVRGLIQQGQSSLADVQQRVNAASDSFQKLVNTGQRAISPWADMSHSAGSNLAGLFGVQGYNQPQWYQNIVAFLHKLFSGQIFPGRTSTASYTGNTAMNLTPVDALTLAIHGSEQFQKNASAGNTVPDRKLNAHIMLAQEMQKAAEVLLENEKVRHLAKPLQKAAELVNDGYPAKLAVGTATVWNVKLAEQIMSLVGAMAVDLLQQRIERTYNAKVAAYLEAKKKK